MAGKKKAESAVAVKVRGNNGKNGKDENGTGLGIPVPDAPCSDHNCPFHGKLRLHGRRLTGNVTSAKMRRTASIAIERMELLRKYDRYERRMSMLKAHNPECISAREGEKVEVAECRPLSKTKHFVIVRKY